MLRVGSGRRIAPACWDRCHSWTRLSPGQTITPRPPLGQTTTTRQAPLGCLLAADLLHHLQSARCEWHPVGLIGCDGAESSTGRRHVKRLMVIL